MDYTKMTAFVCCCYDDQHMLDTFIKTWQHTYPEINLCVLSDVDRPIKVKHELKQYPLQWAKRGAIAPNVINSLVAAAESEGCDVIIKCDVDCLHVDSKWMGAWDPTRDDAMGFKHQGNRITCNGFFGAVYLLKMEWAKKIQDHFIKHPIKTRPEDVGVSNALCDLGANMKLLKLHKAIAGASNNWFNKPKILDNFQIFHCGQFGRGMHGRGKAHSMMKFIAKYRFPEKEFDFN